MALTDQGLGGRAAKFALAGSAMTGTWRVKVHTDPKAAPIAQAAFLVEDFVPERLELKLETPARGAEPAAAGRHQGRRPLSLRPAGRRSRVEGEIAVRASTKDVRRLPRLQVRPAPTSSSAPCASRWSSFPPPMPTARPTSPSTCRPSPRPACRLEAMSSSGCGNPAAAPSSARSRCPSIRRAPASASSRCSRARWAKARRPSFEAILVGADGKAAPAKGLKWQLCASTGAGSGTAATARGPTRPPPARAASLPARSMPPPARRPRSRRALDWGRYRLEVSDGAGLISSVVFNAGYWADEQRRHARGPRRGARQAGLSARRHRARQDHLAHGRPRARHRDGLGAARHPGGGPARRRRRGAHQGRRQPGAPAPTSPSCSIARSTRRPSACPAAPSACAGSPSTSSRAR